MEVMGVVLADSPATKGVDFSKFDSSEKISEKKNIIHVSKTKKPLVFYLNLAKKLMKQFDVVELSALGMAIPTTVTIAEILKSKGLATEKKIQTSTVGSREDSRGRLIQKAKIVILLGKTEESDNLILLGKAEDEFENLKIIDGSETISTITEL